MMHNTRGIHRALVCVARVSTKRIPRQIDFRPWRSHPVTSCVRPFLFFFHTVSFYTYIYINTRTTTLRRSSSTKNFFYFEASSESDTRAYISLSLYLIWYEHVHITSFLIHTLLNSVAHSLCPFAVVRRIFFFAGSLSAVPTTYVVVNDDDDAFIISRSLVHRKLVNRVS